MPKGEWDMELRVLKYFLVVAREENITKAAKMLHITQPTLSRQLMQMEEEFGVSLFKRSKHSIILTEEGMILRRRAQELVDLAEKTAKEVSRQDEVISGEIAIGCGETKNLEPMAKVMAAFQQAYGEVQFILYTGIADDVKERIEQGTLDFGLLIEPVDVSKYSYLRMPLKDRWTVLMRQDHTLAAKEAVEPQDLAGQRLIMPARLSVKNQVEAWLGRWQSDVRLAVYMNLSAYNKMVLTDNGVGLALGLDFDTVLPGLCMRPMKPFIENGSYMAWKKNQFLSPLLERFIEFTEVYLQEHYGAQRGE